ncbi:probable 3-hydroxyisobutyryl-CoA hydrolase 3 [Ziziphus jujuba]|uniref:3-hydroxyisobutyryl-CoA hydrolase n=1 Tax=Ziziphus jujuba TaxID=326968 RepID=A0ABM3IEF5_ZIZJJ|nr:probable 3-hydroxyisobutyryl-CoA hydrolase 3 [Ziziphus jujuba]
MALSSSFRLEIDQVAFEESSCVRKVMLNRPQKLNSLTFDMVSQIFKALEAYENDSTVKLVILKGKGRSFCAGGDVTGIFYSGFGGHWSFAARFYKKQLALDYLIGTYKKPLVSLINGIVMGGGAGLSMHSRFRVVTENTVFAMPETSIGLFPDVGASYFLSKLPGHFGDYLALTGASIKGAEMLACGLATHFVPSKNIALLENALNEVTSSNPSTISSLINKFSHTMDVKQGCAFERLEVINRCFSRKTVEEILQSLEKEAENGEEKWIKEAIRSMKSSSPTSLKITFSVMREGRKQNFEDTLHRDYLIACHMAMRRVNNDFFEGLRALLFDEDKKPKWEPSRLELVSEERVNKHFTKIEDTNWEKLELPFRRNTTIQRMARL